MYERDGPILPAGSSAFSTKKSELPSVSGPLSVGGNQASQAKPRAYLFVSESISGLRLD